jgi:hypothetical protein
MQGLPRILPAFRRFIGFGASEDQVIAVPINGEPDGALEATVRPLCIGEQDAVVVVVRDEGATGRALPRVHGGHPLMLLRGGRAFRTLSYAYRGLFRPARVSVEAASGPVPPPADEQHGRNDDSNQCAFRREVVDSHSGRSGLGPCIS